jgi:hypothetical protein
MNSIDSMSYSVQERKQNKLTNQYRNSNVQNKVNKVCKLINVKVCKGIYPNATFTKWKQEICKKIKC